jgi:hypothetical protein
MIALNDKFLSADFVKIANVNFFTRSCPHLCSKRRVWAAFGPPPTSPNAEEALSQSEAAADGICLDAEGAAWVADAMHGRLLCVAEHGRILEAQKTEVGVFACMLGGDDGHRLFACVAPSFRRIRSLRTSPRLGAHNKSQSPPRRPVLMCAPLSGALSSPMM